MARAPMDEMAFDRHEYNKADRHYRAAGEHLPAEAVAVLAREVVRRLAFRMPRLANVEAFPTEEQIDVLCKALISEDQEAADNVILDARREGAAIDAIYLGYVAGAARHLGTLWDRDEITFAEVTVASGKLYRIIRGLRHVIASSLVDGRDAHPALFALVPGETHTLGIEMATDLFRRKGGDVDMMVGLDHDTLIEQSEARNYRAIVLVAHSDRMMEPLTRLVLGLRITHPLSHIVVAGNILDHYPNIEQNVGADSVVKDIETAIAELKVLV